MLILSVWCWDSQTYTWTFCCFKHQKVHQHCVFLCFLGGVCISSAWKMLSQRMEARVNDVPDGCVFVIADWHRLTVRDGSRVTSWSVCLVSNTWSSQLSLSQHQWLQGRHMLMLMPVCLLFPTPKRLSIYVLAHLPFFHLCLCSHNPVALMHFVFRSSFSTSYFTSTLPFIPVPWIIPPLPCSCFSSSHLPLLSFSLMIFPFHYLWSVTALYCCQMLHTRAVFILLTCTEFPCSLMFHTSSSMSFWK